MSTLKHSTVPKRHLMKHKLLGISDFLTIIKIDEMLRYYMKKIFLLLTAVAIIAITAQASDLYTVENGSYVSTDFQSLSLLLHTQHGTNRYRAIRDILISQGTLIPCDIGQVV